MRMAMSRAKAVGRPACFEVADPNLSGVGVVLCVKSGQEKDADDSAG